MGPAPASEVLNFAYGSNMLLARIRERVPTAQPIGIAVLASHELRWHKVGRDGSAKCSVEISSLPGAEVYGVVYAIARLEKPKLDRAEGLGDGYEEIAVQARILSGRFSHRQVKVMAYRATRVDPELLPFGWYRALVVAGARQHRLPGDYIAAMEAVTVQDDPDMARRQRAIALLQSS